MSYSNINMQNFEEVKKSLESKSLRVCVVGIGRIGLPTALSFAKSGLTTIGVDINESLVEMINTKNFKLLKIGLFKLLKLVIYSGLHLRMSWAHMS